MRFAYLLLVSCLLAPAFASAEWHYAGETFTKDGVVYSVEGSDESLVLLGIGGQTRLIRLGECVRDGLNEYCYVQSAYPNDDDHIRYEAGEALYGYDISIEEVTPDVDVSRDVSEDNPLLNQDVTVSVTIENTGDYRITDVQYDEVLPTGVQGIGASVPYHISHKKTVIAPGNKDKFTYTIRPTAYGTFTIQPTLRYVSEGAVFNASVSKTAIEVAAPVDIKRYATPQLALEQQGAYALNITNEQGNDAQVQVLIGIPPGMTASSPSGLTRQGTSYVGSAELGEDETARFSLAFGANGPGDYRIPLTVTTTKDGVESVVGYNDTVKSTADGIEPSIGVSPGKTSYAAGSQATVTGVLSNENDEVGFRKVQGVLSIPGVIEPMSADQGALGPGDDITMLTRRVTWPNVTNQTTFTIGFVGSYETTAGKRYEFSSQKTVAVAPLVPTLKITQTVTPKKATRGGNVTVTVSAKNVYGAYATVDAHEKLPPGVTVEGGLTYAQVSIDKDATQQLYIYQLGIPLTYAPRSIELTTVTRVQGQEDPLESLLTIEVAGEPAIGNDTVGMRVAPDGTPMGNDAVPPRAAVESGDASAGFFSRMWSTIKGWFS